MEAQERDLLTTLLGRLKTAASQPKDPEADALIRQAMQEQPDAPYFLMQTVLIQDLSLHNAQNQIAQLQQQLTDAQQAARPAATSFLGGLFGSRQPAPPPAPATGSVPAAGPWSRSPQVAAAPPAQPSGQPYAQPQPGYQPGYGQPPGGGGFMGGGMGGGGGGFLRSAAATAAGIAGGALLFQGIESLFGRSASAGILGGQGMTPGLGESVVNNYYGSDTGSQNTDAWGGSDTSGTGGDQDFSSADSGGSDSGGSGGDQDFSSQDYASNQDFSSDQDFSGGGDMNQC